MALIGYSDSPEFQELIRSGKVKFDPKYGRYVSNKIPIFRHHHCDEDDESDTAGYDIQNASNSPLPTFPAGLVPPGERIEPNPNTRVVSEYSGPAPFETLFHDFSLEAIPFYNFWEQDEERSIHDRGNQKLEDLPRFIKLVWKSAPDLPDPDAYKRRRLQGQLPDARDQFTKLSPFGFGSHAIVGSTNNGANWTPKHLQPDNFEQNAKASSNGYVAPGVIEAVSVVQASSVVPQPIPDSRLIDEDDFLSHHDMFEGISYPDFNAALWRQKSRLYGTQQGLMYGRYSSTAVAEKSSLVDGQFSIPITRPLVDQSGIGFNSQAAVIDLKSSNPNSPPISVFANAANSNQQARGSRIYELATNVMEQDYVSPRATADEDIQTVKVKFLHTNMQGMFSDQRVMGTSAPEQAESIAALAPFAGNLAVYAAAGLQHVQREISIPSFNAPADLKNLEYIGYVIEKYEQIDGVFKLVDTFYINGRDYTEYYDAKVKYGVAYRYRIKGLIRWSRPRGVGIFGKDPTVIDAPGAGLNSLTPNDASYFSSEWGKSWAYALLIDTNPPAPPDEMQVRPISNFQEEDENGEKTGRIIPAVEITMKLPYNPQQDICKMTIWKKVQDAEGFDITGWAPIQEFNNEFRQGNRMTYLTDYKHQQDDVTGTKFTAIESVEIQPIAEFAPLNCRFVDKDVKYFGGGESFRYVYAGTCYSRHGEISVLSDQLGVRLNPHWKKDGEYRTDFVSCAGVDKDFDTGQFSTYPERRIYSEVVFKPGSIGLFAQTRMGLASLQDAVYTARIESLDNGQHVDVPVTISYKNQPVENTVEVQPVFIYE